MVRAVANRPVEAFPTDAQAPDWPQGDNEQLFMQPDAGEQPAFVDQDGNPIEQAPPEEERPPYRDDSARPEEAGARGISGRGLLGP